VYLPYWFIKHLGDDLSMGIEKPSKFGSGFLIGCFHILVMLIDFLIKIPISFYIADLPSTALNNLV
jgi:hypothetical protein